MPATGRVRIESAADHLAMLPIVAAWHWQEWGWADPLGSFDSWLDGMLAQANRDHLPATWIAIAEGQPVGSVSLVEHDMPDRPDFAKLSPWLAGLYVVPSHRHLGVASQLVRKCESQAEYMGIIELFLYTATADPLYPGLDWQHLATDRYEFQAVTIMHRMLGIQA